MSSQTKAGGTLNWIAVLGYVMICGILIMQLIGG
jgi:hypothetical protein